MSSIFLESENFHFVTKSNAPLHPVEWMKKAWQKIIQENTTVQSLLRLLHTMKSSFLTRENDASFLRQVILSQQGDDVMMLLKKAETTLLVGTDFSVFSLCGTQYQSFPDIRLPFSERKKIHWWILTHTNFNVQIFFLLLEVLEFPKIFAPTSVIAHIRANSSQEMFEKMQFSELFCEENNLYIGDINAVLTKKDYQYCFGIRHENRIFSYDFFPLSSPKIDGFFPSTSISLQENTFCIHTMSFSVGEIVQFSQSGISKNAMKFTFDTFFLNGKTVATHSGFLLSDRKKMADSGVITFIVEEDIHFRTLSGHIFIDSRGWVHMYEMPAYQKDLVKKIRKMYEHTVMEMPHISRSDLIQILRMEMGKYVFALTGKNPLIIPIIIDKKTF